MLRFGILYPKCDLFKGELQVKIVGKRARSAAARDNSWLEHL
jgi:hypothetical protein